MASPKKESTEGSGAYSFVQNDGPNDNMDAPVFSLVEEEQEDDVPLAVIPDCAYSDYSDSDHKSIVEMIDNLDVAETLDPRVGRFSCSVCRLTGRDREAVRAHLTTAHKDMPEARFKLQEMSVWLNNVRLGEEQVELAREALTANIYGKLDYVKDLGRFPFFKYVSDDMSDSILDIECNPKLNGTLAHESVACADLPPVSQVADDNSALLGKRERRRKKTMDGFVTWDSIAANKKSQLEQKKKSSPCNGDATQEEVSPAREMGLVTGKETLDSSVEENDGEEGGSSPEDNARPEEPEGELDTAPEGKRGPRRTLRSVKSVGNNRLPGCRTSAREKLYSRSYNEDVGEDEEEAGETTAHNGRRQVATSSKTKSRTDRSARLTASKQPPTSTSNTVRPVSRRSPPESSQSAEQEENGASLQLMFECLKCGTKILLKKELVLNHIKRHRLTLTEYVKQFVKDPNSCSQGGGVGEAELLAWEKELAAAEKRGAGAVGGSTNGDSGHPKNPPFTILYSTIGNYVDCKQEPVGKIMTALKVEFKKFHF